MLLRFGLCDACVHQRRVGNTRGSTFSLCGLARTDPAFPKYPRMPVLRCEGFARGEVPPADGPVDAEVPGP
ncbi:hypothetical protein [Patulibacter sp.]|uniref:hypothetical protein n=1 Tax=Patulibacter sp. TaxID=1912859 RepID=UPI0027243DD0|nr:hypothetical protein [Patulibacter sp.]MDO9410032.1 hypothetical protein [Patulibacter sp.]